MPVRQELHTELVKQYPAAAKAAFQLLFMLLQGAACMADQEMTEMKKAGVQQHWPQSDLCKVLRIIGRCFRELRHGSFDCPRHWFCQADQPSISEPWLISGHLLPVAFVWSCLPVELHLSVVLYDCNGTYLSDTTMMAAERQCTLCPALCFAHSKAWDCFAEQLVELCQHKLWAEAFREVYTSDVWTQLPRGLTQGNDQSYAAANTHKLSNNLQALSPCGAVPARLFDDLFTAVPDMRVRC